MKQFMTNLSLIITNKIALITGIIAGLALWFAIDYFIDYTMLMGNQGKRYTYAETRSNHLIAVLFGLLIAGIVYKIRLFRTVDTKDVGSGLIGSILGMLAVGCPACGVTLAGYVGLSSIFLTLPFYGLEVKAVGIILMIWGVIHTIQHLTVCAIRPKKQS